MMENETNNEVEISEKEKDRKSTIYFLIAVGIIIFLIGGILLIKHFYKPIIKNPTVEYNNFIFEKKENLWFTQVQIGGQLYNVPLHYNPYQMQNVSITGKIDQRFGNGSIYVTHDPAEGNLGFVAVTTAELSLNMVTAFQSDLIPACARNFTEACSIRPIINCENTNKGVLYVKEANVTKVELKGNCVVIQGQGLELLRAADRVLYSWYKVMK